MKRLSVTIRGLNWLERLWLGAPIALWFSYQPLMRFGQDTTTYYEVSIALLYVLALALVGLPNIWQARRLLIRDRAVQLTGSFVGLSFVTLFWTPNLTRGILTLGLIGLLYLVFLAAVAEWKRLKKLLPDIATVLVASAVVMSVLALLQVVAGIWLPSSETLLCAGCVADQFGFVRPNGFAIEPQFLGSLLVAPLLVLLHAFLRGKRGVQYLMAFIIISIALILTLSRGAIFAFGIGALLLFVLEARNIKQVVEPCLAIAGALALALLIQGTTAAVNPNVETSFYRAVTTSLNQLSLGLVKLPVVTTMTDSVLGNAPVFNGYVEESTKTRLSLSQFALRTWTSSPARMVFGVGLGGSGVAIHESFPNEIDSREIIQNEYVEILLEYGLVGLGLFVAALIGFVRGTWEAKWAWAFLAAYAVQWVFFSGYPNALHVYLALIALYAGLRGVPTSERRAEAVR